MYTHQRFLREPDSLLRALLESVISSRSLLLHLGCLANRINQNKNLDDLSYALHRWFPLETWFLTFLMARTVTEFLRVCHCFGLSFAALGLSRQSHQQEQEYR